MSQRDDDTSMDGWEELLALADDMPGADLLELLDAVGVFPYSLDSSSEALAERGSADRVFRLFHLARERGGVLAPGDLTLNLQRIPAEPTTFVMAADDGDEEGDPSSLASELFPAWVDTRSGIRLFANREDRLFVVHGTQLPPALGIQYRLVPSEEHNGWDRVEGLEGSDLSEACDPT